MAENREKEYNLILYIDKGKIVNRGLLKNYFFLLINHIKQETLEELSIVDQSVILEENISELIPEFTNAKQFDVII